MLRILLTSLLLTLIYSWDECKRMARMLALSIISRRQFSAPIKQQADSIVSLFIILAALPITLTWLLLTSSNLWSAMLAGLVAMLIIALVAAASGAMIKVQKEKTAVRGSVDKILLGSFLTLDSFMPTGISLSILPRRSLAMVAFLLSLPAAIGLFIKYLHGVSAVELVFVPYLDSLNILLVISLGAIITADILRQYFRRYRLDRLSSYLRIILGIALITLIITRVI